MSRRKVRRFFRTFKPLVLGQIPLGFFLAAALILGYQAATTVHAATSPGSSENEYFRLDWEYDLQNGTGSFTFTSLQPSGTDVWLDDIRLTTAGVTFDSITIDPNTSPWPSGPAFGAPLDIGTENGRTLYEYRLLSAVPCIIATGQLTPRFDVTFPAANSELRDTSLDYEGTRVVSAAVSAFFPIPPASTEFVTVQSIQECQYKLAGDFDNNCIVDLADMDIVARNWLIDCYATPNNPACVPLP